MLSRAADSLYWLARYVERAENVARIEHVAPRDHAAFYASCRFALNITRVDMKRAGHSPSE